MPCVIHTLCFASPAWGTAVGTLTSVNRFPWEGFLIALSTLYPYTCYMMNQMTSFLCEVQCEEMYDEQVLQEINELIAALNEPESEQK